MFPHTLTTFHSTQRHVPFEAAAHILVSSNTNVQAPASPHPSIPATHIHEGAGPLHLENVADIRDEGSSVIHSPDPMFWAGFSSSFTQVGIISLSAQAGQYNVINYS